MQRLDLWNQFLSMICIACGTFLLCITNHQYAVLTIPLGISLWVIGTTLIVFASGPNPAFIWVAWGLGYTLTLSHEEHKEHKDEIERWLIKNIRWKITYAIGQGNLYYFLRETDAVAFKIVWNADNYVRTKMLPYL